MESQQPQPSNLAGPSLVPARELPPPNGVDKNKWMVVSKQLTTIYDLMREVEQSHLSPTAVVNVLSEAAVGARKLAVEFEAAMATARRSSQKTGVARAPGVLPGPPTPHEHPEERLQG